MKRPVLSFLLIIQVHALLSHTLSCNSQTKKLKLQEALPTVAWANSCKRQHSETFCYIFLLNRCKKIDCYTLNNSREGMGNCQEPRKKWTICPSNKGQMWSIHASIYCAGLSLMCSTRKKFFFSLHTGAKNNYVFCDHCYLRCDEMWWPPWFPIVFHSLVIFSSKTQLFFRSLNSITFPCNQALVYSCIHYSHWFLLKLIQKSFSSLQHNIWVMRSRMQSGLTV